MVAKAMPGWLTASQPTRPLVKRWLCGIFVANTAIWAGFAGYSD
jgi:hypothetical protein